MDRDHRILIVEDELVIAENTKIQIQELYSACQVEVAGNSEEANDLLKNFKPTLVLLDIRLGNGDNGIVFSQTLEKASIPFIFLTAHGDKQTVSSAIKTNPVGYMIKPISRQDLFANLELAFSKLKNIKYYCFRDGNQNVRIMEMDIVFLKVDGNYTEIHIPDKRYVVRKSMTKVLEDIHIPLYQIHRNYYVNPTFIVEANASVYLSTGEVLPLSRNYKKGLINRVFD